MADEKRKVAICIGVGQAGSLPGKKLPYLSGAINSATAFHKWAIAMGYESKLVVDDNTPVTMERLRGEMQPLLQAAATGSGAEPIHRLILYFAGHGFIREIEDGWWLLSDWDVNLEAVAVEMLRRRLNKYNIKQVAIFSDACRKMPANVQDTDLDRIGVLRSGPGAVTAPAIDKFTSAQDGSESYMVPGDTPEDDRCIFSGVLIEGLWGTKPAAFSKLVQKKITGRSLAEYLKIEVARVAGIYTYKLDPNSIPTFPEGDDIYFGDGPPPTPPAFPQWPPPDKVLARMGPSKAISGGDGHAIEIDIAADLAPGSAGGYFETFTVSRPDNYIDRIKKLLGPRRRRMLEPKRAKPKPIPSVLDRLRSQPQPRSFDTDSGFAVQGPPVRRVWAPAGTLAEPHGDPNWWCVGGPGLLRMPAPVCIECTDGLFFAATALPKFIGSVLYDDRGVYALVYREVGSRPASAKMTEQAIAALENGALRADTATDFAVNLRQLKHADPVLGVISAYLYDSIGDLESIRRIAYYYIQHGQPIPYDIALLAQLEAERRDGLLWAQVPAVAKRKPRTKAEKRHRWTYAATPEKVGVVGGLWPWMRQGWTFLDDPLDDGSKLISPGLLDLRKHLQPARFATFNATGADILARLFGLTSNEGQPVA